MSEHNGVFSFQVGELSFPVESTSLLVGHLQRLNGTAPEVRLLAGGKETVSLPAETVLAVFEKLWSGEDPITAFLHRAAVESQAGRVGA
jgi:hypothetical protein